MASFGIFGLIGFILVLFVYFDVRTLRKKILKMQAILKLNTIKGGNEMENNVDFLKTYIERNIKIFTYESSTSMPVFTGILVSCEDGWLKVRYKNKIRFFKISDVSSIEVME